MRTHTLAQCISVILAGTLAGSAAAGGITVYKKDEKYVKLGGRIQLQYHQADPDSGSTTDEVFFRRLRPYIEGSLHKDWKGKFQFDLGKAVDDNEVAIKDAYFQYKGFDNMKLTLGNANFPFSREFLTSSKYQQLVERSFVGDHDYGTPDRNVGVHLTGHNADKTLTWGASFASAAIDPDAGKLDFDTPVNRNSDFNEGWIYGGRVDFHPFGYTKFSQGDFKGETKATIGVAAFVWNNDDDNNSYTTAGSSTSTSKADIDRVTGFEISAAFRSQGFSVDAEYNRFSVDTVDAAFTGGMFRNGSTDLENWSIEGGYLFMPIGVELVAGYQSQDADNYADAWTRSSIGANWFLHKHDVKLQISYRMGENLKGVKGSDEDELFIQGQYVF
ncbi:porin [Thiohalobacter sp. IOR34]|uniref:porin n=1 Tax=Thiohalobacter sp. IOR34 TaxID=3057176 RepID=UPI0025B131BD|nr:porin [Thiohalobacter sp. IOR34]WJW75070.1 porin [Thiohalobacter sp. IOR34]